MEPALNSVLRILLRTSSRQEFVAADYVFKSFCEVFVTTASLLCAVYYVTIEILPILCRLEDILDLTLSFLLHYNPFLNFVLIDR